MKIYPCDCEACDPRPAVSVVLLRQRAIEAELVAWFEAQGAQVEHIDGVPYIAVAAEYWDKDRGLIAEDQQPPLLVEEADLSQLARRLAELQRR